MEETFFNPQQISFPNSQQGALKIKKENISGGLLTFKIIILYFLLLISVFWDTSPFSTLTDCAAFRGSQLCHSLGL